VIDRIDAAPTDVHADLDAPLVEIGERRAAAARGDTPAQVWVAGLDHWLRQYRAGAVSGDLTITPDMLSLFRYHGAVVDFERGYRCAVAINAAGARSERGC
jgi:hypothetical protein